MVDQVAASNVIMPPQLMQIRLFSIGARIE